MSLRILEGTIISIWNICIISQISLIFLKLFNCLKILWMDPILWIPTIIFLSQILIAIFIVIIGSFIEFISDKK